MSRPMRAATPSMPRGAWERWGAGPPRWYCWEAKESDPGRALAALGLIQRLCQVGADAQELQAGARRALREERGQPVLERRAG